MGSEIGSLILHVRNKIYASFIAKPPKHNLQHRLFSFPVIHRPKCPYGNRSGHPVQQPAVAAAGDDPNSLTTVVTLFERTTRYPRHDIDGKLN